MLHICFIVGIDIQFGLPNGEVYRTAPGELLPFRLKYLALPFVRQILYALLLGPKDPDVPNIMSQVMETFQDKSIPDVSWISTIIKPRIATYT